MGQTLYDGLWRLTIWASSGLLFATFGCGYQFSGQSTLLFKNVRSIYVEPFVNRSREVGIDDGLTSALRSEFYRRGELRLVDRADQADAILSGVIRSLESHVVSVNRNDEVLQYESTMSLDITLRRRDPDEILMRSQGTRLVQLHAGSRAAVVTTASQFQTGTLNAIDVRRMTDIQLTEAENRMVRHRLIERFARELHEKLIEMF